MEVLIESVDHEARGVARSANKVIFVENALPQEVVNVEIKRRKPSYETGVSTFIKNSSSSRIKPRCESFGVCGGCSFQHVDPRTQLAIKQRVLEDALMRIGRVRPEQMLSPISGPSFEYRTRARLSSRYVHKKQKVLVGFREKGKSYVVDMMSEKTTVLAFRVLEDPSETDLLVLRQFGEKHQIVIFIQRGGPATLSQIYPEQPTALTYSLPDMGLTFEFGLSEFTQVNTEVNSVMVRRAISLLELEVGDRVADMFCGLGNFSLAIARRGGRVFGIESNQELIERAAYNAEVNGLSDRCEFLAANLFLEGCPGYKNLNAIDKLLIDPPRDGAKELIDCIGTDGPKRIVYVSCNPATLARDSGVLVNEHGYRLISASIVNMFPQTSHVESIACFQK